MLNKATLIGRLGADPDIRHLPSGDQVVAIRMATTRRWKDKNTNERKEETEWHRVVFFGGLAKIVAEYVTKGSLIYVEGRIRTQKWQDKDGQDRYTTEIVADGMHMLDSKSAETTAIDQADKGQRASMPAPAAQAQPAAMDDFDDDIPF